MTGPRHGSPATLIHQLFPDPPSSTSPSNSDARLTQNSDDTNIAHKHAYNHLRRHRAHHSNRHLAATEPNQKERPEETVGKTTGDDADDFILVDAQPEAVAQDQDSPPSLELRADIKPVEKLITRVVETVSLIQYIDGHGSPLEVSTQPGVRNTIVIDPKSGVTISMSNPDMTLNAALPGATSSRLDPSNTITSTKLILSTSASSAPISLATNVPSLNGTGFHGNSSALGNSTYSFRAPSSTNTSTRQYLLFTSSSLHPTRTPTLTLLNVPGATNSDESTSSSGDNDGGSGGGVNLTPTQKQMVGGIVGGVAGFAFLALFVMLLLRYKKKRDGSITLGEDRTDNLRALPSSASNSGSGATQPMAERSMASAAVMGAMSNLVGSKRPPPQPMAGEKSFYRVSGRKLPSVLVAGGDGYTDPRASVMSGHSDYSQHSDASDPFHPSSSKFTLGTPMRPISGIPIMRSGPAKTPTAERNPFADPLPYQDSPPRSVDSNSSNRGSRFQERM
ncbi:hypothetical protein VHEMI01073 [[Torrubiella] hemipterigena]|uniref:Uncharacterized protein n=1 Tax=[Torrubiella] hemipterigena TaxID=1531966 RepID=A0A0A1SS40_9HYPO|nr:hypothetical protein VHEMI01073 [[Torrubiella] hemipterigena]